MDVPRLVRTQVTSSELDPAPELVNGINSGQAGLLDVVRALGEFLTSEEEGVRVKGLTFLSNLIGKVDRAKINRPAARTLLSFYLSKLDEFDALSPTLSALLVLARLPSFDDEAAEELYRAIVETLNMKAYTQAVRHQVYLLFDALLAEHRQVFKSMGAEFISSYTKIVDGEKDPRNLMLLFQLDRIILQEFNVAPQIEEMFDITFCYFPITFRPPPNDPYGITADDLKLALRNCVSATPHLAKMALPLFLEKFQTAAGPVMKDLLLTMAACFPVYGAEAVGERGTELWDILKTAVLYSSDTSVESAALSGLESLLRTLYPTAADVPKGLAQEIIKQCLAALSEPEKTPAAGSAKCLAAMVRASPSTAPFALSQALPQLFRQFNQPTLPAHRVPILNAITTLLLAARSVYAGPDAKRSQEEERSLEPYREPLLDVLREGLRTDGLKVAAVKGSVALAELPRFWGRLEVEDVVKGMDDLLINDGDDDVRTAVLSGLKVIASTHPDIVQSLTLPILFHSLPEVAPAAEDAEGREKYRAVLKSLTELCAMPALFETLVVRVTTKLDLLSTPDSTTSDGECAVAYAWDLLHALRTVIDTKLEQKHVDVAKYYSQVAPRLFGLAVKSSLSDDETTSIFRDRRLLVLIAAIAETLFWEQPVERQDAAFAAMYAAFENGEWAGITYEPSSIAPSTRSPLQPLASQAEQNLVVLYTALVRGLKPDTPLPCDSAGDFLRTKVQWAIATAHDDFQLQSMLDLITAFVNKHPIQLGDTLAPLLEQLWATNIQDTMQTPEERRRALLGYLHIVKALALLRHDLAYTALERVVEILTLSNLDPVFVDEAARGFGVLASGKKGKGKSHLTAKLLHAQKLWSFLLPKLIAGDKDAEGKGRLVYLTALASLLPLVPASIFLSNLPTILPLLIRSLSLPDPVQRTNVIVALTSILETANSSTATDKLLHEQAETMLDAVLRSAIRQPGEPTSGRVRAAALTAVGVFPDAIRYETLSSAKARVVRALGRALDDPLRSVRREAVDTRARWYSYGS